MVCGCIDALGQTLWNVPCRLLNGSPCRSSRGCMWLHVAAANSYFYPGVLVTCSQMFSGYDRRVRIAGALI